MKLLKTKKLFGTIKTESGLHIGSGDSSAEIGGGEASILKCPANGEPYIPGSSLKGKMRALAEWKLGRVGPNNGRPCACGDCAVCRVFGAELTDAGSAEKARKRGPTRLIVRDAYVNAESRANFQASFSPMIEAKAENTINRVSAEANSRVTERVVPGLEFDFELLYRVFDLGDGGRTDEEAWLNVVLSSLALLQADALGGGGSRGNGKIAFANLRDEAGNAVSLLSL